MGLPNTGVAKYVVASTVILSVLDLQCYWLCLSPGSQASSVILGPMILGLSGYLGVSLPLGVFRVDAEPEPQGCSGSRFRPYGTHSTGFVDGHASQDPGQPN